MVFRPCQEKVEEDGIGSAFKPKIRNSGKHFTTAIHYWQKRTQKLSEKVICSMNSQRCQTLPAVILLSGRVGVL
jgi:hypothetical protein